jgi:hypothetical protein
MYDIGWVEQSETQLGDIKCWVSLCETQPTPYPGVVANGERQSFAWEYKTCPIMN